MSKKNEKEVIDEQIEDTATEQVEEVIEKTEVELLEEEIAAKNDAFLRLTAEYDNFRKRSAKEKTDSYNNAFSVACEAILPVYDTLTMAIAQIDESDDSPHKKGLELTLKQIETSFTKLGIEGIESEIGTKFDANLHNAIMHIENADLGENEIAMTFQKGFKIGDKVIRHSTVQVAN